MRFVTLTTIQLGVLSLLVAVISAVIVSINTWWIDTRLLPVVHVDTAGVCIKVENFENGHAFGCPDVNVLLRRYRTVGHQ